MAAGETKDKPRWKFSIKGMDILLYVSYATDTEKLSLRVRNEDETLSSAADGWKLLNFERNVLGEISRGKLQLNYSRTEKGLFSLLDTTGTSIELVPNEDI